MYVCLELATWDKITHQEFPEKMDSSSLSSHWSPVAPYIGDKLVFPPSTLACQLVLH